MTYPLLVFAHIPKTGGLTMRRIIDQQIPSNQIYKYPSHSNSIQSLKSLSHQQKEDTLIVYGHCRFGVHEYFGKPFKYISMLRDPVNRIISTYYFIRSSPSNKLHDEVKKMSLEEYIYCDQPHIQAPLSNHQTRFISGLNEPDLQIAKRNIRKHFLFIGITEMYPESVFILNRTLGWPNIPYSKQNVTRSRPKQISLTQTMLDNIRERNQMDLELYHFCKRKMKQKVREFTPTIKKQLDSFVHKNR